MSDDRLKVRQDGEVAILTLSRPERRNALDSGMMRALAGAVERVAGDEAVRCVVLTGEGEDFCVGGDLRAISKASQDRATVDRADSAAPRGSSFEKRVAWLRRSAEASRLLHTMGKPTIAMVRGACAGAGLSLAAACDFRHAARSAVFRSAFVMGGVPGDYGGSWLWTRILGSSKARQLYLIDAKRTADEALAFGLIDAVHDEAYLEDEVMTLARQLAALPGAGVAYAKANLNAAMTEPFESSLDRESVAMLLARDVMARARDRVVG